MGTRSGGGEAALFQVRHELDMLLYTRRTDGFRPADAARYRELCALEEQLLEAS